jgi:hypothetical protein
MDGYQVDKIEIIFEDKKPAARVGGYDINLIKGDGFIYYNNKKKRRVINDKLVKELEDMTPEEIEYVKLERIRDEEDWAETKRLQKEYGEQIDKGITW